MVNKTYPKIVILFTKMSRNAQFDPTEDSSRYSSVISRKTFQQQDNYEIVELVMRCSMEYTKLNPGMQELLSKHQIKYEPIKTKHHSSSCAE